MDWSRKYLIANSEVMSHGYLKGIELFSIANPSHIIKIHVKYDYTDLKLNNFIFFKDRPIK